MKLSYRFLQEFLPELEKSSSEVAEILTKIGFEVTGVTQYDHVYTNCIVGKILKIDPHPNANKLQIVTLRVSPESNSALKIVCGASNVRENAFVPVALLGCVLPGEIEIKKVDIRGVSSTGMICSLSELGLERTEQGIWIIEESVEEGQNIENLLDLQDTIFEVEILSNRSDCLSVWGIARELSVACNTQFVESRKSLFKCPPAKSDSGLELKIKDDICDTFFLDTGINVQMNKSTQRVQQILKRHEVVPHNVILDTVALSMILYGHPLHVYDGKKVGRKIQVSQKFSDFSSKDFLGLDEKIYTLDDEDIVVADENGAISLAGILGGKDSLVTDQTEVIYVESAIFSGSCIRKSRKKKGIQTKAAFLFEQGTTGKQLELGRNFVLQTLSQDAGIRWTNHIQKVVSPPQKVDSIYINEQIITRMLGYDVPWEESVRIFCGIGCEVEEKEKGEAQVSPPTWRKSDLGESCDLVEEILRHTGYDKKEDQYNFPLIRNSLSVRQSKYRDNSTSFSKKFYQVGQSLGYKQVFTTPLVEKTDSPMQIVIDNPMLTHQTYLRDSFFAGMLSCVQYNVDRGRTSLALMEIDSIFYRDEDGSINEKRILGLCLVARNETFWNQPDIDYGISKFSAHILTFLRECCGLQPKHLQNQKKASYNKVWDEDFCYGISREGKEIAKFGVVCHKQYLDLYKNLSEQILFYAELNISILHEQKGEIVSGKIFTFPCVYRDFAVVICRKYWLWPLQNFFQNFHPWIQSAEVKNIYEGDAIEEGKISVVFSIAYRDRDKTLTKKDVELVENDLAKQVVSKFEVQLR